MANKKILIEIKVNDKATPEIKNTGNAVDGLAKGVKLLTIAEQEEFVISEQARMQKTAQITGLKRQAAAALQLKAATNGVKASSGLNNAILLETGRLASDASYGFQGIANNLGQLLSLFQTGAENAGGFKAQLLSLKSQIFGVGGLLIGIQLLISFLPQIQKAFKKSRQEGEGLTVALKAMREEYTSLRKEIEESNEALLTQDKRIDSLLKSLESVAGSSTFLEDWLGIGGTGGGTEGQIGRIIGKLEKLGVVVDKAQILKLRDDPDGLAEYISKLVEETNLLDDATDKLLKRRQQLEVNKILGVLTPVELAEENLALFIATQEATAVKQEEYIKSTEYLKLLARLEKAKMDAREEASKLASEIDSGGIVDIIDEENKKQKLLLQTVEKGFGERFGQMKANSKKELDLFFKTLKSERKAKDKDAKEDAKLARLYEKTQASKLEALAVFTDGFSRFLGEQTAAGKAFASATALIDTYAAVRKVWKDEQIPFAFKAIAAAGVLAGGLADVNRINSVNVSGRGSSSAAGGTINAPDFNVVGTSETSQLAQAVGRGNQNSVVKAYVVGSEITSQQEFDRQITNTAGL